MIQEPKNFLYVQASLHWTYQALMEIYFLNRERPAKEIELVTGPPFQFYRVSLHYMFTMEYIKLMEKDNNKIPDNHFASLEKLSNTVYTLKPNTFINKHVENSKILAFIRNSEFFLKIKGDRDKKFAHTDIGNDTPLSHNSFSDKEIEEGFDHIQLLGSILDNCTKVFNYSFAFQHTDPRTDNFIKLHSNYKAYYYANYFDAVKKGYR